MENYNNEYEKRSEAIGEVQDIMELIKSLPPHTKISNICTEVINTGDSSSPRMFSFTVSGVVVCDDEDDDWDDDWDDEDDDDLDDDEDDDDLTMLNMFGINPNAFQNQPEEIKNVKAEVDESL